MANNLISNTVPSDWTFGFTGPVLYNGNLYCIQTGQSVGSENVQVWKSTNGGTTWSEMDGANRKNLADQERATATCFAFGSTLRIYHTNTSSKICITDFDMSTDTWGTTDASTESIFTSGQLFGGVCGVRRSDGSDVVFWQSPKASPNADAKYMIRTGVGSWGSAAVVADVGTDSTTAGICLGGSDRTYFVYWGGSTSLYCKTLTSSNTLGSEILVASSIFQWDSGTDGITSWPYAGPLVSGGNVFIPFLRGPNIYQPEVRVAVATDADSPTFSITFPDRTRVPSVGASFSWCRMAEISGNPWIVFAGYYHPLSFNDFPNPIFASRYISGNWETAKEVVAPTVNIGGGAISSACYDGPSVGDVGLGENKAGIIFIQNGKSYYAVGDVSAASPFSLGIFV